MKKICFILITFLVCLSSAAQTQQELDAVISKISDMKLTKVSPASIVFAEGNIAIFKYRVNDMKYIIVKWNDHSYLMKSYDLEPLLYLLMDMHKSSPETMTGKNFADILLKMLSYDKISLYECKNIYIPYSIYRQIDHENISRYDIETAVRRHPASGLSLDNLHYIIASYHDFAGAFGENAPAEKNLSITDWDGLPLNNKVKDKLAISKVRLAGVGIDSMNDFFFILIRYNGKCFLCPNTDLNSWPAIMLLINRDMHSPLSDEELLRLISDMTERSIYMMWKKYNNVNCAIRLYNEVFRPYLVMAP